MNINLNCPLFLKDLYSYDIKSCYYEIANQAYYDLNGIDKHNKSERNIELGKLQITNPNLQKYLQETADSIIDYYIFNNNLIEENIIVRQRDGFIITKLLKDNDSIMKLDFREHISFMLITLDRRKYITVSEQNGVTVKGVPNNYTGIMKVYDKFKNLNMYNKKGLFKQLSKLKQYIFECDDIDVFTIDKNDKKLLLIKKYGVIEIKKGVYSTKSIDREKYYQFYIKEFVDSLILSFV